MKRGLGASPEDVARFLSRASDDAGCAWLCRTAGSRSATEEQGIGQAVASMAHHTLRLPAVDMLRRVS